MKSASVKSAGRAWEDASEPVQDAYADRDAGDDALDGTAQQSRLALASRGISAVKEAPYTSIFPQGIGHYIAAPLDAQVSRYQELVSRLTDSLAEEDVVRTTYVPRLESGIATWSEAAAALSTARTNESIARTNLEAALDSWCTLLEKVYGTLVADVGRSRAERFFPRNRRGSEAASEEAPA